MRHQSKIVLLVTMLLITAIVFAFRKSPNLADNQILSYTVDCKTQEIQFYWKNDSGVILKSILNLKNYVEQKNKSLVFAMNAGMYNKDCSPQGLFIQRNKKLADLDTANGIGNFYLMPNGVFYISLDDIPHICQTKNFRDNGRIKYATQSGPMLLIEGNIHPSFKEGSVNLNIRNGVGILPDNRLVFAMSKKEINFYDFAQYFKSLGCRNALYLDGFVSRTYLPEKKWIQTDGNFGVMIGITKKAK